MKTFFQLKVEIMQALYSHAKRDAGDRAYLYIGSEEYAVLRRGDGDPESFRMWGDRRNEDETFLGLTVIRVCKANYLHVVVQRH